MKNLWGISAIILVLFFSPGASPGSGDLEGLDSLVGAKDAVLVTDPEGRTLLAENEEKGLIPASTLKILTSLIALHYLGRDHRFCTEFYLGTRSNLKIRGYGDPMLVSEGVEEAASNLAERLRKINALVLDDSYFAESLSVPGRRTSSYQPYDAPNGALCVNFNTVSFRYEKGRFISAEPQTPLLPTALKKIRASGLKSGRILLSNRRREAVLYAGRLFSFFLREKGVQVQDGIRLGKVDKEKDRLIYRYISDFSLTEVIARLMKYSNNFMANQLLIAAGAKAYGPPGSISKGIRAALSYSRETLGIEGIVLAEGSGLSRRNKITAERFEKILRAFEPFHGLLNYEQGVYYKTGTLKGIRTCAGYIEAEEGLYRFVIFCNTPGRGANPLLNRITEALD